MQLLREAGDINWSRVMLANRIDFSLLKTDLAPLLQSMSWTLNPGVTPTSLEINDLLQAW